MNSKFTIGADPELFFKDGNGKLISVIDLVGGTKEEPKDIGNGCAVQEDNVAAEFCIPACESAERFIQSINYSLETLRDRAQHLHMDLATLVASGSFTPDQLEDPRALRFGCDPDYNAYTGKSNPRPKTKNKALRSAGGHVHIGYQTEKPEELVKCCDIFLGVPSVLMDQDEDRRKLYGKAGAFRYKPYGVEYRTLSNFWIWRNDTIDWVYHQVKEVIQFFDKFKDQVSPETEQQVQDCINNNNKDLAKFLVNKYQVNVL